ncbi:hypothetical protein BVX98_02355 [bacterium F11]|nr:hypothetical protein BVX98_02355 [bacterium F11]
MKKNKVDEKRYWTRVSWGLPVDTTDCVTNKKLGQGGRLRNISKQGFSFATDEAPHKGALYEFRVNPKVDPIILKGRVLSIKNEGGFYVCSIRLEGLSLLQKAKLNRFLSPYAEELKKRTYIYSLGGGIIIAAIIHFIFSPSLAVFLAILFGTMIFLSVFMPF